VKELGTVDEQTTTGPDHDNKPNMYGLINLVRPVSQSVISNPPSLGFGVTI
jgi:hypothetical protein